MAAVGTETATDLVVSAQVRGTHDLLTESVVVTRGHYETVVTLAPGIHIVGDPADIVARLTEITGRVAQASGVVAPALPPF